MPHINFTTIEVDGCNYPIFVSSNIEDKQVIHSVCRWENSTQLGKTVEIGFIYNLVPSCKGYFAIGMFFPELD